MSTNAIISWLAVLALGGFAAWQHHENRGLQDRLQGLEVRVADAPAPAEGTSPPALGGEAPARALARIDDTLGALAERVGEAEARLSARERAADAGPARAAVLEAPALDEKVREIVLDMAGDVRFRERLGLSGAPNLPKKPAFGQLAEVLELDATQEDAFRKDLLELKERFMTLISIERDDGVVILEEIQKVEALPEHDPKRATTFMTLFTLKVPGSEDTYLKQLMKMTAEMRRNTERYLRQEQVKRFNSLDLDLLGIEME